MKKVTIVLMLVSAAFGCSSKDDDEQTESAPQTFQEQVSLGADLYTMKCASCHGNSGQGTSDAPPLVGLDEGALPLEPPATAQARDTSFVTVADVAAFAVANMPPGEGGSLSTEQYLSVLAFDLSANGIELDEKLTLSLAKTLEIPRN
jgi:mono/diheme cytochrome c family protein